MTTYGSGTYGLGLYGGDVPPTFVPIGGTVPSLRVEIDFTNPPTNPVRIWTDVTADVRALSYERGGRNGELQRTEGGTLTAVLNNQHGNYYRDRRASPYYPGVKRMRWIRVRMSYAGVVYPRWQGLITLWQKGWPAYATDATVTVTAADQFKVLNLFDLDGLSFPAQRTDERVAAILAAVGLPAGVLSLGASSIEADTFAADSSALSHLLQVEEHENGLLVPQPDGTVDFQSRYYRLTNSAVAAGTAGDVATEIRYREAELNDSDDDVWNDVAVSTKDTTYTARRTDAASTANYFQRRLSRTLLNNNTLEADSAAEYLVGVYADSAERLPQLELLGMADPTQWPTILSLNNSSRLTWLRRTTGYTVTEDVYVERIADEVRVETGEVVVKLELSPASNESFWVLGTSQLGVDTRLAY